MHILYALHNMIIRNLVTMYALQVDNTWRYLQRYWTMQWPITLNHLQCLDKYSVSTVNASLCWNISSASLSASFQKVHLYIHLVWQLLGKYLCMTSANSQEFTWINMHECFGRYCWHWSICFTVFIYNKLDTALQFCTLMYISWTSNQWIMLNNINE